MQRPRGAASGVRRQATSSPQELFSVQITGLPPGVSSQSLVDRFQQSAGQFVIPPEPKQRDKTAWCAYLNGLTENQAETFQERWNNKIFPGGQHPIRCKTSSSKLKGSENIQGKATQPQPMIYNVELSGLPPNASNKFLAATFKQSAEKFEVLPEPKQRDKTAWCAYLNDVPESEAHRFIQKYDNFKIGNNKFVVRCRLIFKADRRTTEDRSRVRSRVHGDSLRQQTEKLGAEASSSQSSVSTTHSETTNQDKGILCKYNILGTCKFDNDCKHIHMSCPMEEDCDDDECCLGHPANVKTQIGRSVGRRLVLCNLFRFGACRYESECRFKHLDCPLAELCEDSCCFFGHPQGWGSDFSDPNECSVDCDQYDCTKSHPVGRTKRCQFGDKCTKFECSFLHSEKRQACESAGDCQDFDCSKLHPESREEPCVKGAKCLEFHCQKLHPASRELCDKGKLCTEYACDKLHEAGRRKKCKWRDRCKLPFCPWLHPINRSKQFCDRGDSCDDFDCALVHPPGRCSPCKYGERCWNHICECLHPEAWNPCPNGLGCRDVTCDCSHSPRRPKPCTQGSDCRNRDCAGLHPGMSSVSNAPLQRSSALKSDHQRRIDREANRLPVLNYREQFLERLQTEKVLIVRAETGSGKTTQLPQYAAECFGGLVICTQPRVMAAVSIAHRVAQEFDGCDVGESVGYKVGGENSAPGSGIMFMTESCLIRYCQSNESLDNVSVLIVDEAHERSLNVDIVLGLAKLIRIKRPDNFYVVIASATIDPQLFRDFFNCGVLDIPGRMYDVSLQYIPPAFDSNPDVFIKSHLVPSLIKALRDHSDGYALVFLPGEREIQQAIKAFQQQQTEDNCVALPLYGSLPREEQVKVLDFKPSQDSDRLVVFCTNVAETSLTINGVRLVVDSGLAKESRFDAKRRITVLELRQISQSAANQRKGRAGRTAPGHCVRLYSEDVLKSAEFVPEILRSSLDLVVLLLIKLKLKPLEFPFLDKPNEEMLIHSYQTLMDLGCLSGVESLSNAGELFAELGLDPRLSAFIVRAHEHFGQLELAVTVACILTAPGSIFFLGRDKEKKEGLQKRALEAFSHESDILYEVSVFDSWSNAGKLINGKCKNCGKVARNFQNSCRSCRVGHSNSNRLNNKVMEHIEKTRTSFLKTIKKSKWFLELQKVESSCEDTIQVVGSCLEQVIPEQVTCLLVKRLPSEGIKIVDSNIRARISNTSVFAQRPRTVSTSLQYELGRWCPVCTSWMGCTHSKIQRLCLIEGRIL
ncbi:hypothetical protein BOX15_Mlig016460g2 [Macrostomum lignano]|uniref:RNA helicase n=1 Tax=Macrostomum lignano TaxID=282301 RepID=A0A267GFZ8_9PLAT|nr:hypothetical protein BOX15_Mlig016460g2 [Macrostomum lignano]